MAYLPAVPVYWRQRSGASISRSGSHHAEKETHMKKIVQAVISVLVLGILAAGLSGCKKEGPMERSGKEIDKAAEKAGDKIEKAGDKIKDAVK
jgi:hypothetical protein